ncbi:MAG: hypothetical protein MJ154_03910, partial [Candidatus Saccharibacteria bacterium]|nr:hypothetical protein [Candidatus Saccharibacteria bacterium]
MKIIFRRGRRTRLERNSKRVRTSLFALVAFLGLGAVVATFAATLENDVRVDTNAELKYYLTVKEDGVDASGKESNDSTVAQVKSGRIEVTDKIPDGLVFQSFVKTSDGTIGAVSRGDKSVACAGKVIDDTNTDGTWNADNSEFTYHGLHYNKNTGIVSFAAEKVQAGCELTVGIVVKTPETVDDPTTSQIETRRDFFNT